MSDYLLTLSPGDALIAVVLATAVAPVAGIRLVIEASRFVRLALRGGL